MPTSDTRQLSDHRRWTEMAELPELTPPSDVWPSIQASLQQAPESKRASQWNIWSIAAAVVMVVGIAAMLPRLTSNSVGQSPVASDPAPTQATQPGQGGEVAQWIAYSQTLEQRLRDVRLRSRGMRGHQALALNQLQNMVALVDGELARQQIDRNADQDLQLALWQRRATLLQDMLSAHSLATEQDAQPVMTLNRPATLVSYQL